MSDLADLPEDVADAIRPHMGQGGGSSDMPDEELGAVSRLVADKRDKAVTARTASGIEAVWLRCEEAYVGIDDTNRKEFSDARWAKPISMDGPVTTDRRPTNPDKKSTVFIRMTARYVDAGAAKLYEILLPPDDKAFKFNATPVPELIEAKEDKRQVLHDGLGNAPLMRPAKPGEIGPVAPAVSPSALAPAPAMAPADAAVPASAVAGAAPQVPVTVADFAQEQMDKAQAKAQKAEDQVYDWMVESQYTAEMRKVIFDAARCGTGVLKGPVPKLKRAMAIKTVKGQDGKVDFEVTFQEKLIPSSVWVDFWNIYPDPACGEDIHNGDHILECDWLSEKQLRDLKSEPGYIASQIDAVIESGPDDNNSAKSANPRPGADGKKERYQVWYFYGALKRKDLELLYSKGTKAEDRKKDLAAQVKTDQEIVYAIVTLVGDKAIKAALNPLASGSFPYNAVPWQRRSGHWAGIGIGEQLDAPQRMINASTRAMLNNAGKSAGSQVVINRRLISAADGRDNLITPDKLWYYQSGDGVDDDVRKAITIFDIPNTTAQLMSINNYAMQLAEESTSIPLVTQGQSGETTPDTFGGMQLQNNNANQLLRSIGYAFDDYVTEPLVRKYYEWYLRDPDIPSEDKGEFEIDAHGSIALVERAIMDQTVAQIWQASLNPAYGLDPERSMEAYIKSKRLTPKDFQLTPEQKQRAAQNQPKDPRIAAAEIAAQSREKVAAGEQALGKDKLHTESMIDLHGIASRFDELKLEYALKHGLTLEQVKAQLAETVMKLRTEERLNAQNNAHDKAASAMEPPVQAPGRAADGEAFSQAS